MSNRKLPRRTALGAAALALAARHAAAQGIVPAVSPPVPGPKRIVFVVSNLAMMLPENMPIGYWLPELAHPWWRFAQAGMTQVIASPAAER